VATGASALLPPALALVRSQLSEHLATPDIT